MNWQAFTTVFYCGTERLQILINITVVQYDFFYLFLISKTFRRAGIKLQKVKKQQYTPNFCSANLDKEMNTSKCGKVIQMITGYFLTWRTSYLSFPSPPVSKVAAVPNFPPWERSGCQIPWLHAFTCLVPWVASHPLLLGQTIDRRIIWTQFSSLYMWCKFPSN